MNERSGARTAHWARMDLDALRAELCTSAGGLDEEQAVRNRAHFGENQLAGQREDTVLHRFRRAFLNPFSLILLALAGISLVTDVLLPPDYLRNGTTVLIILSMLLTGGTVRLVQELRARRVLRRLGRMVAAEATVRRDGYWRSVPAEELVVGDLVRVRAGDPAPADLRITAASELFVSQSALTGESAVLEKRAEGDGQTREDGLSAALRRRKAELTAFPNLLLTGAVVTGGSGEGIVLAVGRDTVYGGLGTGKRMGDSAFERGAASIAWVLIRFMAVLIPVVFLAVGITKNDWAAAFLFALSVAVGLTPELLPMVVNACLARGSALMGRRETLVRSIGSMQALGSMDVLCVDKTGTLTQDRLHLEYYMDVLGNESRDTLDCAWLNSHYHTGVKNQLDEAVLACGDMPGGARLKKLSARYPKLDEVPFDYERRFASVLVAGERENLLLVKGDVEAVCRRCSAALYRGERRPAEGQALASMHAVADEMLEDGMKVMAVAFKPMGQRASCAAADEEGLTLLGYLAFFDAPKKSAAAALSALRGLHVDVRVLTGDQPDVALSVCRRLGIAVQEPLTGAELDAIDEEALSVRVERTNLFASLSPRQKARVVRTLRANGHTVGFLGDGMNDLPAILEADVGISAENAAEAVREGADVILLQKDLGVLGEGILEGRRAFANMSKYIRVTTSSNFGNICSIVAAGIFLPFLPMTSVQLLLLNLLYDLLCLALPWDHVDSGQYAFPREWSGRTLGRFMRFFGPLSSVFDLLTFAFLYWKLCPALCGGPFTALDAAGQLRFAALFHTGWFLESMWTQVLILQLLRTEQLPFVQSRPSRVVALVTLLGIAAFTLLAFTPLGGLLGLTALPPEYFGFLALAVPGYMLLVTAAKTVYVRRFGRLL